MNGEYTIKHNSLIESFVNASEYKPFLDYLKQNIGSLSDFIISEKEILSKINHFDYECFLQEFKTINEFENLDFKKNPYDDSIFHIIIRGTEIPKKYTQDVIREIAENGYDTSNVATIVAYWEKIEKDTKEAIERTFSSDIKNTKGFVSDNRSENFAGYDSTFQSQDGAYGNQIYKEIESGRFYSVPSYDNYSDTSNS